MLTGKKTCCFVVNQIGNGTAMPPFTKSFHMAIFISNKHSNEPMVHYSIEAIGSFNRIAELQKEQEIGQENFEI